MEKYAQELVEVPKKADNIDIESCNVVYDEKDKKVKMDVRMIVDVTIKDEKDKKELLLG